MYTLGRIQSDHENLFQISKQKNFNQEDKDYRSLYDSVISLYNYINRPR